MALPYTLPSQSSRSLEGAGDGPARTSLVVLAAGMGSRFGGIKQLESVGPAGETILEYSLYDAWRAGFSEVVFIIRKAMEADFHSLVLDRFRTELTVRVVYQETWLLPDKWADSEAIKNRIKPWGTGHALWCARNSITSPFAVINADDFYGFRSYALLQGFLASRQPDTVEYAMVAFELGRTLSAHGPVARGICSTDSQGLLTGIVEHTKLARVGEPGANSHIESLGTEVPPGTRFSEDRAVSMNLFGFTPKVFPALEDLLDGFLATASGDPKAEFYLPGAVQSLIDAGLGTVRVLRSPENWFGLTYKPDLEEVRAGLRRLVQAGVYPASLRGPAVS